MVDKDEFYLTLPSNGAISMSEYPNNRNNSWKTRLNRRIRLNGEWEVGLANVSYPSESRLTHYLQGLKDEDILLKTGRYVPSKPGYNQKRYEVTYGDIKNYNIFDLKDLFQALFKEEYIKVLKSMDKDGKLGGIAHGALYGQSVTTSTEDSFTLDRSTLGSYTLNPYVDGTVFAQFPLSFLSKFDFIKMEDNVYKPTENMKIEFANNVNGWYDNHRGTSGSVKELNIGTIWISIPYDINVTFLNLKSLSHTKGSEPRSLYVYCSLCNPQNIGEDTQQLLSHVNYEPSLKGGSTYEPQSVTYRGLHSQEIDRVEIQIKEEDRENFANFASGASIVTLHLRRI